MLRLDVWMVKNPRSFPQSIVLERCGVGVIPELIHGIRTRRLAGSPPQPPISYKLSQFMGVEVQVGPGRSEAPGDDFPEPLNHALIRWVGAESGDVLFDDIDSSTRNPDPLGRKMPDRPTGSDRVELPPTVGPPCSDRPLGCRFRRLRRAQSETPGPMLTNQGSIAAPRKVTTSLSSAFTSRTTVSRRTTDRSPAGPGCSRGSR
jgi:hypothetical protein